MPSGSDLRAGGAFVELTVQDKSLVAGLRAAGQKLKDFGAQIAKIGAATAAAGAAITAPIALAVKKFSEMSTPLAKSLKGAFKGVEKSALELSQTIGKMFASEARDYALTITGINKQLKSWAKSNEALIRQVGQMGKFLVAAGAVAGAFGFSLYEVGSATEKIAAHAGKIGSVIGGALLSPLGLVTVGLTAGVAAWMLWTDSGQAAFKSMSQLVSEFAETFKTTFGGITDALVAGDLALAGKVAMAGLKVAMLQGVSALSQAVGGGMGDFFGSLVENLGAGDLTSAWEDVVLKMTDMWTTFCEGIMAAFTAVAKSVAGAWESITGAIAGKFARIIMAFSGEDERTKKLDKLAAEKGIVGSVGSDADAAEQTAKGIIKAQADAFRATMDQWNRDAQRQSQEAGKRARDRFRGGGDKLDAALETAQEQLGMLRADAAAKANAARRAAAGADETKIKRDTFGTFSAAAASAFGAGNAPIDKVARNTEKANELLRENGRVLNDINRNVAGQVFI